MKNDPGFLLSPGRGHENILLDGKNGLIYNLNYTANYFYLWGYLPPIYNLGNLGIYTSLNNPQENPWKFFLNPRIMTQSQWEGAEHMEHRPLYLLLS